MLRTFTVAASKPRRSQFPWLFILFVLPCIVLEQHVFLFLRGIFHDQPIIWTFFVAIVLIFSLLVTRWSGATKERFEVSVFICELSIQISTYQNGKLVEAIMIPKKSIIDLVVNEIILSHRVVSVLTFRLLKCTDNESFEDLRKRNSIQNLLAQGKVQLQVAFPGAELSYKQCLNIRLEMMESLGIASNNSEESMI